jgi:hypothetical protein
MACGTIDTSGTFGTTCKIVPIAFSLASFKMAESSIHSGDKMALSGS